MDAIGRHLRTAIGQAVRAGREAIGWTAGELARHAGVSKAMVARVEAANVNVTVDMAGRLLSTLGVTVELRYRLPFSDPRQRDAAHARCVAYVQRRLEAGGWIVRREVEIVDGRSRGWIDVLAWHPETGELLVIEVKTEIVDVGVIERTLGWYGRASVVAARRLGWTVGRPRLWLLVLATDPNDDRIVANRDAFAQSFPDRVPDLEHGPAGRGLALIDPRRRRRAWLIRTRLDGRRTRAPYANYADFMRRAA